MANNLPRLGGGVAKSAPLSSTPFGSSGISQSAPSTASILASGINDLMKSAIQVKTQMDIQRNEEDKIRAVSQAEIDHLDANNAFDGGSSDADLNSKVADWRSSGLTDSEVRLGIKNYKFNKAKTDLGINDDNKADDANVAYFNTFSKLELKALSPMLAQDRKLVQEKISNMNSSYVRVSDDDLQTKYNNISTTNKSYGMGEKEAMGITMQSAFDLARNGDDTLLRELHNVKTSTGERLLDTLDGSTMFSKLNDNLLAKKEHDVAVARKEADFQQEVQATKLYTDMVDTKDLHSFKINMDNALETGQISMQQHNSLNSYYKTATNVESFPKQSDRITYIKAYSLAEQGLLSTDNLMTISSKLSNSDFELISRKAIEKGGINGVGNDASKGLQERIKDDASSFGGSSGINDLTLELHSKQIFPMRTGYIQQNLKADVDKFITTNNKIPNEEEYSKLREKVVNTAEKLYNEKTVKPIDIKAPAPITKADNANGRQELINIGKSFKTSQERDAWYNSLTPVEQRLLKGI